MKLNILSRSSPFEGLYSSSYDWVWGKGPSISTWIKCFTIKKGPEIISDF